MTWPITLASKKYRQKYQDVTPSPSERAGVRPPIGYPNFTLQVPQKPYLSMAEGRGEATNWLSDFTWQVPQKQHLSMAEARVEASE